ncbi:MAG: SGNH/GDSL hydrolase family protein [Coleofasciculus sp. G1-WW12-02]|uniref:SGNH/GDSL hydrolase family protein n=1 Tax=Coleofasciculus sp. G1-WW12-02 TaxID=3068483 RepID=UPI0032FB0214
MKNPIVATSVALLSLILPFKATAASFSGLYVFGDSLSDSGNVHHTTGFPPFPYIDGHFSNGLNWIDYLAQDLHLEPTLFSALNYSSSSTPSINFAFGGATTGQDNTIYQGLLSVQEQIAAFQTLIPPDQWVDPNALYILWAGANDYLPTQSPEFVPFTTPETTLANITGVVNTLAQLGAKTIMVVNLPDLGNLPLVQNTPIAADLNMLTTEHNRGLQTLSQTVSADINLIGLDVNTLFHEARAGSFGFSDVEVPCFNPMTETVCANPNEHLFWDAIHVTTAAHRQIATLAVDTLNAEDVANVPEPASVWGLLLLGVLGMGVRKSHSGNRILN